MQEVKFKSFSWIDFRQVSKKDVEMLKERFAIHPIVLEEFSTPTMRPKAAEYENCLYLTVHIPLFDVDSKTTYPGEIDVVITHNAIITAHEKDIFQLTELLKQLSKEKDHPQPFKDDSPGALLHYLIEMLFESCFPKLDHIAKKLDYIEEEIFAGHEKEMVFEISVVKRDILNFRRTMKPQRSVIESLSQKEYRFINPNLRPYFQDLIGTNIRIWNNLESTKETIESLEATNNSLLSNKLDMTMKVLTIFSAIMLPLTVYSNILAMSASIPFGNHPMGFWIHAGIMIIISVFTITIFKAKKWL